ncbi:ABC transporter ATP-binding protein [Lapidilactobacillus gannanensis]|jgi:oligopeptide transport system ATP-binding protein|uniref:ABC transporter ATP-binding protein n=1 Tax=Lapidilactobacillus gannanensis TaxID=2486002 RepID=A0ABW4BKF5_9LACO|nr:ABC transporter ATP-binding protein [Lapidilactobacillus gannanensis]MCH4057364.1 ABC transporter ATP-binding protein [Lactobacillaceae bacterium]
MTEKSILTVKDLSVGFHVRGRELKAIRNVSLELKDQETLAIVGESGSGKSVLTKTFTGMLEQNGYISHGTIDYDGQRLSDLKKDKDWEGIRGKEIATIFQDPMTSLDPIKTIGSQIAEVVIKHQGKSKKEAKEIAIDLMDRTGIPNAAARYNEYPFEYSGGMRQRIVIAIALACHPKVLICDEPTTALDVTIQAQILELIKELQKDYHFTTIFITHDLGVVASIADRIAVMYSGEIIEVGTCREIFYDPRHPYTWSLLSSLPQLAQKGGELYSIPGTPPSLYKDIKGDAFAPRNPFAMKVDFEAEPPMFQVSPTHFAKTWLLDPRAPKVEKPALIQNLHERFVKTLERDNRLHAETEEMEAEEHDGK